MEEKLVFIPASPSEISLYCCMGEALCMIQELEEALSHSITLKKYYAASKKIADEALNKHRKNYTLGKAVQLAGREKLYPEDLQNDLNDFYKERNWLVHKSMFESRDDIYSASSRSKLFQKIKSIADKARKLQHEIELDMADFCSMKGRDMSKVQAIIEARYNQT